MPIRHRVLVTVALLCVVVAVQAEAAPVNDTPLAAELVDGCSGEIFATTVDATNAADDLDCPNVSGGVGVIQPYGGDVFYKVIVPWSYDLHILVEPLGDWDVSVHVFTSPWNPHQTCVVASDESGSGFAEMVQLQNAHTSGQPREYYIAIDSWRMGEAGDFRLDLTCDFAVPTTEPTFSTLKSRFGGGGR